MAINFGDDFAIKLGFKLEDIKAIMPELSKYIDKLSKETKLDIKFNTDGLSRNVKELESQLKKMYSSFGDVKVTSKLNGQDVQSFTTEIKRATGEVYRFKTAWNSENGKYNLIDKTKIDNTEAVLKKQTESLIKEQKRQVEEQRKIRLKAQQEETKAELKYQQEIEKAQANLGKKLDNMQLNPKKNFINDDMIKQIELLKVRLDSLGKINGLDNVKGEIKSIGKEVENLNSKININKSEATDRNNTVWGKFTQNAKQFTDWFVTARVITEVSQAINQAGQDILNMNTALTDLNKVVDMTNSQMNSMRDSAVQLGKEFSASSIDIMKGMSEYGRVTKNLEEIKELSKQSILAGNVTDLSPAEASKGFITVTKQMGMELKEVGTILDSMNEIQNNYRTSAEDLISGISETGAVAKLAGVDIYQLEGYITGLVEATGESGNEIGTSLKSIISRIYRVGAEGASSEGKPEKALASIGVAVRDSGGEFRKLNDILNDTQAKWGTLSKAQQMYVSQQVGGTHHYQKFISLMQNYNQAMNASETATNSYGSAMQENEKVVNSFQGKLKKMMANMEEAAFNSVDDGFAKSVLNIGVALTGLVGKLGLARTAIATFFAIKINKNYDEFIKLLSADLKWLSTDLKTTGVSAVTSGGMFSGFIAKLRTTSLVAKGTAVALKGLKLAMGFVGGLLLSFAIEKALSGISHLINASEEAKEKNNDLATSIKNTENALKSIEPLTRQQAELESKINSSNSSQEQAKYKKQLLEIQKQIVDLLPEGSVGFLNEAEAIDKNTASIRMAIEAQKEEAKQKAQTIASSSEFEDLDQRLKNYSDLKAKVDELKKAINDGTEFKGLRMNNSGEMEEVTLTIEEQKKQLSEYESELEKTESKALKYNANVVARLKNMGFSNDEINSLGIATSTMDNFTQSFLKNKESQKEMQAETKTTSEIIKELNDAFNNEESINKATDNFKESTKKIQELQGYIDDINKNGISGKTALNIVENYSELAGVIDDDTALMDGLNNKIKEQQEIQERAYEIMMGNDTNFYNTKIKNNDDFAQAVNDFLGMFVDENGNAYTTDLNNFNNYNEMKSDALGKLQDGVNRFLSQFVGENGQSYRVDLKNFTNLAEAKLAVLDKLNQQIKVINKNMDFAQGAVESYKRMGSYGISGASAFMDKYLSQLESQKDLVNSYIENIDKNIGSDLKLEGFSPGNLSPSKFHQDNLDKDKNKKKKEIEDMEKLSDRYYAVNNALQKLNNELERYNRLLENAKDEDRIKLQKEKIDLLYKEIEAQKDLRNEKQKEMEELRKELSNNGFNFDDNGTLTNESYINSLVSWANGQNSKDAQDRVKKLYDMVKQYTQLLLTDIPKIDNEILNIKNEVISAQKDIAEVLKKQRDERIKQIEEVTEKTKKAIQEQKDAYNKAFEQEDYEDKLKSENDKLAELQAHLLDAQRTGDMEQIKALRKQIEEQRKVIDDAIKNKDKSDANDLFDKELSDLDKVSQDKIDEIKKKLSDEEILKMVQAGVINLDNALNNIGASTQSINDTFIGVGNAIQDGWLNNLNEVLDTITKINDVSKDINMTTNTTNRAKGNSGVVIEQSITINGNIDKESINEIKTVLKEELTNEVWKKLYDGYRR